MGKIIILTDSTCDLSSEIIKEREIEVMPLKVCFSGQDYLDGVEINTDQMYEKIEQLNELPKTAAVSIEQCMEIIEKYVQNGENDLIYTGIGSKLSSSYQNFLIAAQNLDEFISKHVYTVDSNNLSTGIGLLVLKMCDMRDSGMSATEIVEKANQIVPCIRAQFSVKELTFLHKGGRCSGTAKFFGTMLRIRPILRVINGAIILDEKIFGKYEKALNFQIQDIINNQDHVDNTYLFITHSCADEEAQYIFNHLPQSLKEQFKNIFITKAGCVVSSHCGKNTIGILYIKDSKIAA